MCFYHIHPSPTGESTEPLKLGVPSTLWVLTVARYTPTGEREFRPYAYVEQEEEATAVEARLQLLHPTYEFSHTPIAAYGVEEKQMATLVQRTSEIRTLSINYLYNSEPLVLFKEYYFYAAFREQVALSKRFATVEEAHAFYQEQAQAAADSFKTNVRHFTHQAPITIPDVVVDAAQVDALVAKYVAAREAVAQEAYPAALSESHEIGWKDLYFYQDDMKLFSYEYDERWQPDYREKYQEQLKEQQEQREQERKDLLANPPAYEPPVKKNYTQIQLLDFAGGDCRIRAIRSTQELMYLDSDLYLAVIAAIQLKDGGFGIPEKSIYRAEQGSIHYLAPQSIYDLVPVEQDISLNELRHPVGYKVNHVVKLYRES